MRRKLWLLLICFALTETIAMEGVEKLTNAQLIAEYKAKPASDIRLEIMRRKMHEWSLFAKALDLTESTIPERGTYNLGEFEKLLPRETTMLLSDPEGIAALDARIREYIHAAERDPEPTWVMNVLDILAEIGNENNAKTIASLAYTTFNIRVASKAIKAANGIKQFNNHERVSPRKWWDVHFRALFSREEIKELDQIRIRLEVKASR